MHIDSKVKWNLVILVLWWLKQGFSISPHEPLLPAHAIVPSSNLGSNKLLAAIESDRCFYFIPEVVRMGVAENTKVTNGIQSVHTCLPWKHCFWGLYMHFSRLHASTQWMEIPQFYSPSFLYPKLVGNMIEQDPIVALFPPSLQLVSLTGHPV